MASAASSAGGGGAVIAEDLRCVRCEYSVRGLAAGGACPECGLAIGETLLAARAVGAGGAGQGTVVGARMLAVSAQGIIAVLALAILTALVGYLVPKTAGGAFLGSPPSVSSEYIQWRSWLAGLFGLGLIAALIVQAFAVHRLTPPRSDERACSLLSARVLARIGAWSAPVITVLLIDRLSYMNIGQLMTSLIRSPIRLRSAFGQDPSLIALPPLPDQPVAVAWAVWVIFGAGCVLLGAGLGLHLRRVPSARGDSVLPMLLVSLACTSLVSCAGFGFILIGELSGGASRQTPLVFAVMLIVVVPIIVNALLWAIGSRLVARTLASVERTERM